jgi:Raf kinase inhibitor-like YbhB/YbcL family protein
MEIDLASPAFREGEPIPKQYTGDGKDLSPPMTWPDAPGGTQSFALICEDPDAPRKTWVHWVVYNIPAARRELAAELPKEARLADGSSQGVNDFGKVGYGGPAPPPGKPHRYFFRLFALDQRLPEKTHVTRDRLMAEMNGHILAEGQLIGTYGR